MVGVRCVLVVMSSAGIFTLPEEIRPDHEGEVLFEVVRRQDDVIELRPVRSGVQESHDRSDYTRHESGEELLRHLEKLAEESRDERNR